MTPRLHAVVLAACVCAFSHAQVRSDRALILSGTATEDRQVSGLPDSNVPGDLITTSVAQQGSIRTFTPDAGAVWAISMNGVNTPVAGTHIVVRTPAPTSGAVQIGFNGSGPFAVVDNALQLIDGAGVPEGTALSLVFDGAAFQVMNGAVHSRRPCPEGSYQVNDEFCVELIEHEPSDFFEAVLTCGDVGMRLCTWGEFIVFCQAGALGNIQNVSDDWEWTGDASNENGVARVCGLNNCLSSGNSFVTNNTDRAFHCCYSR